MAEQKQAWTGVTFGSRWLLESLVSLLRLVDVRVVYAFSALLVIPVTLCFPGARHQYRFLRQRMAMGRLRALWNTYRNHCLFGQVVIDRFAMYAGKTFPIRLHGYEHFDRLAKGKDSFVQLSAHVGNYELAGYSLVAEDKVMHALVFAGEKATVMESRERMFSASRIRMIPIMPDGSHLFAINSALAGGEIVSMPADRVFGSGKTVAVSFLGSDVHLPQGPFRIAVMRGCKVLSVNVMKYRGKTYDIYVTPLPYDQEATRETQVRTLAQAYADELERVVRQYPTQWYNYFDFFRQ